jgi:DNA adenine methylase
VKKLISPISWVGGKGNITKFILSHLPNTKVYVEPFGGGGVVLLNKPISQVEVYNDIDSRLTKLFEAIKMGDCDLAFGFRYTLNSRLDLQ